MFIKYLIFVSTKKQIIMTYSRKHSFIYKTITGVEYTVKGIAYDRGMNSDMDVEEVVNAKGINIIDDLEAFDLLDEVQNTANNEAADLFPEPTEEEEEQANLEYREFEMEIRYIIHGV